MLKTNFNFLFGERKTHAGYFGENIGLNGNYSVDAYGTKIKICFTTKTTGLIDIEIKDNLFGKKIMVNGKREDKIISRHFKFSRPKWKIAYEFNNRLFYLFVDSGPDKNLSFRFSDWKEAFKKEFKLTIKEGSEKIGSISGPGWTLEKNRSLTLEIIDEKNLVPLLVLIFIKLTESNADNSGSA